MRISSVTSCSMRREARILDVREIRAVTGDEVVHPDDLVSFGKKVVREVRADESGGAGDEGSLRQYACFLRTARHVRHRIRRSSESDQF